MHCAFCCMLIWAVDEIVTEKNELRFLAVVLVRAAGVCVQGSAGVASVSLYAADVRSSDVPRVLCGEVVAAIAAHDA